MSEQERLSFIEERDGHDAALKFAEQTIALYVIAAIRSSKFYESIAELQVYLTENNITMPTVPYIKKKMV